MVERWDFEGCVCVIVGGLVPFKVQVKRPSEFVVSKDLIDQ